MCNKFYIDSRVLGYYTASDKAKSDISRTISSLNGYKLIPLSCKGEKMHISNFHFILEIVNLFRYLRIKDSIILVQHPFQLGILNLGCLNIVAKRRNKIIILSHDLNSIRYGGMKYRRNEIKQFKAASCIISHNEKYTEALREMGIKVPIVNLGVFDYYLDNSCEKLLLRKFSKSVSFVGNLEKSAFIEDWLQLSRCYDIELIGSCSDEKKTRFTVVEKCVYKGVFSPEEVPFKISGSFGLVWDGYSVDACDKGGKMGEYLKYNNPHKFSLYLAAGIPVIVWKGSALAAFVEKNGVGITINSLKDLDMVLSQMTESVYEAIVDKIKPVQKKITSGGFTVEAINKAESLI